jgi:hypothetical protein
LTFEVAYQQFMEHHFSLQKGEPLRRLREGHGFGEKLFLENVWWPAFGHFDFLHPEHSIIDMRYGSYYLDYAYLPNPMLRLAIEIDGFGPHVQQLDRRQFAEQLNRQNFLVATDWKVLRFSVDEIKENASRCIQYLQLLLGRYYGAEHSLNKVALLEREALRLGLRLGMPFSSKDVVQHLQLHRNTAQALLRKLADKRYLVPAKGGGVRVHTYQVNEDKVKHIL